MSLAEAIKQLRAHLGITQQELAFRTGLSVRGVAGYEGGTRHPEARPLALFADLAAQAGRHDLSFEFADALLAELRLDRLQLGIFSRGAAADATGYLLLTFRDPAAREYARAFFEAFGRFSYGNAEEKAEAKELLQAFHSAFVRQRGKWGKK